MEREPIAEDGSPAGRHPLLSVPPDPERHGPRLRRERHERELRLRSLGDAELLDREGGAVAGEGAAGGQVEPLLIARELPVLVPPHRQRAPRREVHLEAPQLLPSPRLDPREALLAELCRDPELVALVGAAAVGEPPLDVDEENLAVQLLGQLAVRDDPTGLVAQGREAVEGARHPADRHRPGRRQEDGERERGGRHDRKVPTG